MQNYTLCYVLKLEQELELREHVLSWTSKNYKCCPLSIFIVRSYDLRFSIVRSVNILMGMQLWRRKCHVLSYPFIVIVNATAFVVVFLLLPFGCFFFVLFCPLFSCFLLLFCCCQNPGSRFWGLTSILSVSSKVPKSKIQCLRVWSHKKCPRFPKSMCIIATY